MTNAGFMTRLAPHAGFVLVYLIWGINVASMKIGGREWDPFLFNGLRYLSLVPVFWGCTWYYYRKQGMKLSMKPAHLGLAALIGILSGIGMEAVLSYALQFTHAANGALLGRGITPIFTALFAILLAELRLTWRLLTGIPLAFAGALVMAVSDGLHFGAETLKGDLLLLSRSLIGACYLVWMNRLMKQYPMTLLLALEMTFGALSLLTFALPKADAQLFAAMSWEGWFSLLFTTLMATLVGFTLHNWSLGKLGPFKSSVYGYLQPLMAALAGWWFLGEQMTWNQWVGGAGVLTAMYLVQSDRMQQQNRNMLPARVKDKSVKG
mgnify:CR=1 FL=1